MKIQNFRDLIVWQKAFALAKRIHDVTATFPSIERYGLVAQLRRAGTSVPSNIAEGHGRLTVGEYLNALSAARGSLNEIITQVLLAAEYGYITAEEVTDIEERGDAVSRLLWALIRSLQRKRPQRC